MERRHSGLIALLAAALILVRVLLHFADRSSILDAARRKGWTRVRWAPFAPGFFFEHGERHCCVIYVDGNGRSGEEYCKTSLLTGVFWRDGNL